MPCGDCVSTALWRTSFEQRRTSTPAGRHADLAALADEDRLQQQPERRASWTRRLALNGDEATAEACVAGGGGAELF